MKLIFKRVRIDAKSVMSVCTHVSGAPAGQISVKFDIREVYEKSVEKIQI